MTALTAVNESGLVIPCQFRPSDRPSSVCLLIYVSIALSINLRFIYSTIHLIICISFLNFIFHFNRLQTGFPKERRPIAKIFLVDISLILPSLFSVDQKYFLILKNGCLLWKPCVAPFKIGHIEVCTQHYEQQTTKG